MNTNKNILLINPRDNLTNDNDIFPRLGLVLLGTILKKKGYNIKVIHMVADNIRREEDYRVLLENFKPDIVGITLTTYQTKWTRIISRLTKDWGRTTQVVIGGSHPSAVEEKALDYFSNVDIAVLGEGEKSFINIVEETWPEYIAGICFRGTSKYIKTPRNELIQDLDSLPFPDYSLVDLKRFSGPYPMYKLPNMSVMGSRGCPYGCTFCSKAIYGRTSRLHSPRYILELIKYLKKDFGVKEISFEDDTFNLKIEWAREILEGIIKEGLNKDLTFRCGFRVNNKEVTKDFLLLMKRANFWNIFYGVESGNQKMLDLMDKHLEIEEIQKAFKLAHSVGLRTQSPFIIGLPGETEETIKDSFKLCKELNADYFGFARAMPFPGTPFDKEVREKGHIKDGDNFDSYSYLVPRIRTDELHLEELEKWVRYGSRLVVRKLIGQCLTNPKFLLETIKAVGTKEVISKIRRNLK